MIGQSVNRIEDLRLVTGHGRYTDDHNAEGQLYCVFVRSPHAHANVTGIDAERALYHPGVLGVFTAADLAAHGVQHMPSGIASRAADYPNRDGTIMVDLRHPALATDRVRYVGQPTAVVIAETLEAAIAASEKVAVDFEILPAVTSPIAALAEDAPDLWRQVPGNVIFDYVSGDETRVAEALARAAFCVTETYINNRIAAAFTEPRAALATYEPATGGYHVKIGCQSVHGIKRNLAQVLGIPPEAVRVTSPDTGGGFGARSVLYPEYVVVAWAAKMLARPIKWTATRAEEFQATTQARDAVLAGTLALDEAGRIIALKVEATAAFGAHHAGNGPFSTLRNLERMLPTVYDIPALQFRLRGVFTNTTPISSYRGVGRVEANYLLERLIDTAARTAGLDRMDLRRMNVIPSHALPKQTEAGALYDSGDYAANMDIAQRAGGWDQFPERRVQSTARGKLRGIALCNYIEGAGGVGGEYGRIEVSRDGNVKISAGCVDQGQGHETVLRQLVAHVLGIDHDVITKIDSDTGLVKDGVGTNASRSMVRAGKALADAAEALIARGRTTAARLLQREPDTLQFEAGAYVVAGSDQSVTLFEVARAEADTFAAEVRHGDETVTYPCGCHLCEVEIDPETGEVSIENYIAVDDVGRAVNPMLVHGQSRGAIAQGIGQALSEHIQYDETTGQLVTGSFMDYAPPRASDLPMLEVISNDRPSPFTPFGIKGAGEGGTTGAPATVINAILDALSPIGVSHIDMPATSEKIWRLMRAANAK